MWNSLAHFILRYKLPLLVVLLGFTVWMGFEARKVQMSYEFSKAIPTDNIKYQDYQCYFVIKLDSFFEFIFLYKPK